MGGDFIVEPDEAGAEGQTGTDCGAYLRSKAEGTSQN